MTVYRLTDDRSLRQSSVIFFCHPFFKGQFAKVKEWRWYFWSKRSFCEWNVC